MGTGRGRSRRRRVGSLFGWSWVAFGLAQAVASPPAKAADVQVSPPIAVDPIATPIHARGTPADIASDGTNWMVLTWDDDPYQADELAVTRVSADGTVIGYPFMLAAPSELVDASLSFDGTHYVATWVERESASTWSVRRQRIALDGSLVGGAVEVSALTVDWNRPVAAGAGRAGSDLVIWCTYDGDLDSSSCSWSIAEGTNVVATDAITFDSGRSPISVSPFR